MGRTRAAPRIMTSALPQEPVRHRALMHKKAIEDAREHDGDRVVQRLLHRAWQVQMEGPVRQQHEQHQHQLPGIRSDQQDGAEQCEGDRRNIEQHRRLQTPARRFADEAVQRDEPGAPGIEMRERGRRRLFTKRVVPAREADRRERLDLVPVHDCIRHIGMKVGEALPQIDGRQPRETRGWQEQNQADQRESNQPLLLGEQAIENTNPLEQRWRPIDQCQTDGREPALETNDRNVFQAGRHTDVRRQLDLKLVSVDLVGILNGGIEDEGSDVLERMVRQRVTEGSIPFRIGQ